MTLILDDTKLRWHRDRVLQWMAGERIAPIEIDMALTRACQYNCVYCYGKLQENVGDVINERVMRDLLDDAAEMGVKSIAFQGDGESTLNKALVPAVRHGHVLGLDFGMSTNGHALTEEILQELMPRMRWIRVNFSAGDPLAYAKVMGVTVQDYEKVVRNISRMVQIKAERGLGTTLGMQMVCRPQDIDQAAPYVKLAQSLGVDYAQIKHCADNNAGSLGIDYTRYTEVTKVLEHLVAEAGAQHTQVSVKFSKMADGDSRTYNRCFGPRFLLQISGSGLVAPCGMMFDDAHKDFWIGNICRTRLRHIWKSDAYWAIMDRLSSPEFNPSRYCGSLCVQHCPNKWLNADHKLYDMFPGPSEQEPEHVNFI